MKFGYFCNTTNWDHKPYNQLSDETRDGALQKSINGWMLMLRQTQSKIRSEIVFHIITYFLFN